MKKGLLVLVVFAVGLGCITGCKNACNRLYERVCSDLGNDCEVFSSNEAVYTSVMPKQKYIRKAELSQCQMYLSEENYQGYTLPYVRFQVARLKDPQIPAPRLSELVVESSFLGLPSFVLYLLPIVCIVGILLYTRRFSRPQNRVGVGKRQS